MTERLAKNVETTDDLPEELSTHSQYMGPPKYGLASFGKLFTDRQLLGLLTLTNLIGEVRKQILHDLAKVKAFNKLDQSAYADAIITYLSLGVSRVADINNSLCMWENTKTQVRHVFTRQAVPMLWDFAEPNLFGQSAGDFEVSLESIAKVIDRLVPNADAKVFQVSATDISVNEKVLFSTDPPYYDNVPYADLSDFFYVWLRRSLSSVYPELLSTILVPKQGELVADHVRHGSRERAKQFFEDGMKKTFSKLLEFSDPRFPTTIYYAFKQTEGIEEIGEEAGRVSSTGWETMLEALLSAGFCVSGTLPLRTELANRSRGQDSNALASSILLVCRRRNSASIVTTRRELLTELKASLPLDLQYLKGAGIAATDLAQAAIGPGMSVFSRYSKVLEADGTPMTVRTALGIINQVLDEVNSESEGDFDPDSRWAITWFETHGFEEGAYGEAETLSKAKNTSTSGLVEAGVITSRAGKVKLIPIESLPEDWDPKSDSRLTVWEATHHLIRVLETKGEEGAATLLKNMGVFGEVARDLAYRLYSICERKKWAKDALRYNGLIISWSDISKRANSIETPPQQAQASLF